MGAKAKRLTKQRKRLLQALPPVDEVLRGTVFERRHKCGKSYCRCATGEGHRTFYLTVSLAAGKTEQISLPVELVPKVRQWVENYRQLKKVLEQVSAVNRELIRVKREELKAASGK